MLSVGSVSRTLPVPGLDRHAIGFKSLADAIWLRNHVVETLEKANATDDPARREQLLTYVFVGGGYAGSRGARRAAGLRGRRDGPLSRGRACRGCGGSWSRPPERVLPEIDLKLADYAVSQLRGRGIEIRLGTQLEEVDAGERPALDGRDGADHDRRLDGGRQAAAEPLPPLRPA